MTRTTDVRSNHARVTAMRGHGFEVNVMKYLFLLLLLAAQPMVAVLAAATLPPALASAESVAESPAELTLIKEEACAVLAAPNEIETIVTPRGPGFVFTTVGGKDNLIRQSTRTRAYRGSPRRTGAFWVCRIQGISI